MLDESFSKWQLSDNNNFSILVFFKKAENQCFNAASVDYGLNSESDPCLDAGSLPL